MEQAIQTTLNIQSEIRKTAKDKNSLENMMMKMAMEEPKPEAKEEEIVPKKVEEKKKIE